jgi:hypothetical protein
LESTALLPQLDAVGNESKPDWAKIEAEYRAGVRSIREIAREHGVSQPAISKYAQRHGWTREPEVITEVITATDNPPDNQGDNRKLGADEAMRVFNAGMKAGRAEPILAEPAWAGRPDDGFWESEDARECIVANRQHAVAVYTNNSDQIVIRQERDWDQDEDTIVIVDRANAAALVRRVYQLMGWKLPSEGK